MYPCKFGQNPSFGSEYNARKQKVDADANADAYGIRTKKTIYPPPSWSGGHKYLQSPSTITIRLAEQNKDTRIVRESDYSPAAALFITLLHAKSCQYGCIYKIW